MAGGVSRPVNNIAPANQPQDVAVASNQLTTGPHGIAVRPKPTIALFRDALDAFNIRGTTRLVAFELFTFWQPGGEVYPAVGTLAEATGLKPRAVQYALSRLSRVGLWVRVERRGKTNVYELRLAAPLHVGAALEAQGMHVDAPLPLHVGAPEVTNLSDPRSVHGSDHGRGVRDTPASALCPKCAERGVRRGCGSYCWEYSNPKRQTPVQATLAVGA